SKRVYAILLITIIQIVIIFSDYTISKFANTLSIRVSIVFRVNSKLWRSFLRLLQYSHFPIAEYLFYIVLFTSGEFFYSNVLIFTIGNFMIKIEFCFSLSSR